MGDVSRRDLLRWSLYGGGVLGAGSLSWLTAGCGPGQSAATTVPTDPARPWWMQANFAPVFDEIEVFDLTVRGALPPDLSGMYVKNGSNPAAGDSPHWFFGDGMVHSVRLEAGRATAYRNKWVRTEPYLSGRGFGEGAPVGANSQSNVSAIWHGGALLTSGEIGWPYRLEPADLSTIGPENYGGRLPSAFTAHPKIDPATGKMHAFGYGFTAPFLHYVVIGADGRLESVTEVPLPRSTMIHDFAITATDVIFWDLPVVFDMEIAMRFVAEPGSGAMPFVWKPDAGARIGVMPLGGPASAITWHEIEPCYVFHGVNAFRRGDEVVVDVCRLSSMFAPNSDMVDQDESLRRWTIDTAAGTVTDDILETEDPGDLPSRDPRRVGREHRHGYLVGTRPNPDTVEFGDVIKHDFVTGTRIRWNPGPTRHGSEPLFVPGDPGDDADDAGWLLVFVHDDATGESTLAVLDATDVAGGPVAEVVMPRRVPYGFHGTWIPAEDLTGTTAQRI